MQANTNSDLAWVGKSLDFVEVEKSSGIRKNNLSVFFI